MTFNRTMTNNFPKLHNATWPGVVGKGDGSEPPIGLDTMLDLTAAAEVDGQQFDGVDLFLFDPHVEHRLDRQTSLKRWPRKFAAHGLVVGSVVAPVWPPTGGGSAMGDDAARKQFLTQVRKACRIARTLRAARHPPVRRRAHRLGLLADRVGRQSRRRTRSGSPTRSARRATSPRTSASGSPPRAKSAGAACTAGATWSSCSKRSTARRRSASRPTWPTRCSSRSATTRRRTASCRPTSTGTTRPRSTPATSKLTAALRPWTIDFHVAQNDATVYGSGSHDKTGRHCLPNDPNGKLDIVEARRLLAARRQAANRPRRFSHICWDGCMFPNETLMKPQTWNDILGDDDRGPRRARLERITAQRHRAHGGRRN